MSLKDLKDWVDELRGIKAKQDAAAKLAEEQRLKVAAAEAAEEARRRVARKRQFDALLAKWDSTVRQHLAGMGEAQWGDSENIILTSPLPVDKASILKGNEFDISWRVCDNRASFGVTLHFRFDDGDKIVPIKFVVSGARGEIAKVELSALKNALTKVFRAGPYQKPSPSRSSWADLNIGGSPLS